MVSSRLPQPAWERLQLVEVVVVVFLLSDINKTSREVLKDSQKSQVKTKDTQNQSSKGDASSKV
jgi:hypothetical protein